MTEFNEKIMKKVEEKEKHNNYVSRCLAVSICPTCGSNLGRESFADGGIVYRCLECKFTSSV